MKHVKECNSSIEYNQQSIRTAQHTCVNNVRMCVCVGGGGVEIHMIVLLIKTN
jgi:hypothetical protein